MWRVYENMESIDLQSLASPPSSGTRVDLLTFGVGGLSGLIVEAGASQSREFDLPRSCRACLTPDETVDRRTAGMCVNSVEGLWRLPNGQEIAISTKARRRCMLSCIQR